MFKDYKEYYYEGLVTAFTDYVNALNAVKGGNLNLKGPAMQAANMLYHFREQLPAIDGETLTADAFGKLCSSYNLVRDVFNSTKHKTLNRKDKLIIDSDSIKEVLLTSIVPDGNNDGPRYHYSEFRIVIFRIKLGPVDFLQECTILLNFWADYLTKNKLLDYVYTYQYTGDVPIKKDIAEAMKAPEIETANPANMTNFLLVSRTFNHNTNSFEQNNMKASLIKSNGDLIPSVPFFLPQ